MALSVQICYHKNNPIATKKWYSLDLSRAFPLLFTTFFSFRADISPPTLLARYLLVVCPPLADVRTQTGINQSPGAFRVGWAQ